MLNSAERRTRPTKPTPGDALLGEPPWDVALLFPNQGQWSEEDFLWLDEHFNRCLIELVDGALEVLPVPDPYHQRIVQFLFKKTDRHATKKKAGEAFMAPLPVRLGPNHLREPDILFVRRQRIKDAHKPPEGADLVMEVVSRGKKNRDRDLKVKRRVYAKAKIGEYWIVDPQEKVITVLILEGAKFKVHGKFGPGETATSKLLPGFAVKVNDVFAAGLGPID